MVCVLPGDVSMSDGKTSGVEASRRSGQGVAKYIAEKASWDFNCNKFSMDSASHRVVSFLGCDVFRSKPIGLVEVGVRWWYFKARSASRRSPRRYCYYQ
jgi:hypothetical protein